MRTKPNTNKNRHSRPYERPGNSSSNVDPKGFLSHMKDSVSELFNQSWIPSFLRSDTTSRMDYIQHGSTEKSSNDSYVPTASTSSLLINQIYPEEGNIAGPSTSNAGMVFKLNNVDKYKSGNLLKKTEPLISSTPLSSSNFVGVNNDTPASASVDMSVITPNIMSQLDISDASTSQTPVQIMTNRSSISKKRLRDTLNDTSLQFSNTSFQNRSLPQISALSSKRPRFNTSTYGTPVKPSDALAESSLSIFYPGKTMYGGAANYKKSKCISPLKTLQRSQVKTQPAPEQLEGEGGLSTAAKRILSCLEKMSTPLSEAKKMPMEKGKLDYFDSPYISDFHKHRPSLRTESPRTPPISSLVTASKTNTRENLASFLRKQGTSASQTATEIMPSKSQLPAESSESLPIKKSPVNFMFNITSAKSSQEFAKVVDDKIKPHNMKISQDSFKITSKKGVPQFDNSPIEVPDLPNISLPVTSLPLISFGSNFKPAPPVYPVKNKAALSPTKEMYNFKVPSPGSKISPYIFSSPEVLRDPAAKLFDADISAEFVFSKPHSEKDGFVSPVIPKNVGNPLLPGIGNAAVKNNKFGSTFANGPLSPNWADKFKPACDSWECGTCCIRNKGLDSKCVACQTPKTTNGKPSVLKEINPTFSFTADATKSPQDELFKGAAALPKEAEIAPQMNGFGSNFMKKEGQWTCDACLIDNKKESDSCVACMTPRPGSNKKSAFAGFGSPFSVTKTDWECDVCLVRNKESSKKCVACGSLHPSVKNIDPNSEQVATGFTFGVSSDSKNGSVAAISVNKSAEKVAGNFSFGIKPTSSAPSSGTFMFGSGGPAANSGSSFNFGSGTSSSTPGNSEFKFGVNTSSDKTVNKFGVNTSSDETVNSEFKFGSTASSGKTPSSELKFGPTASSVKSSSSEFKFGPSASSGKTPSSELKFGLSASSGKTPSSELKFGANFTKSNKTELCFENNKKADKSSSCAFTFGTKPAEAKNILENAAGVSLTPKLPAYQNPKDSENKLPFDIFKIPAPAYDAKFTVKASQQVSEEAKKDTLGVKGTEFVAKTSFSSNGNKIINKDNMFSFGGQNLISNTGFNFGSKQSENNTISSSALDLFSNKSIAKTGLATIPEKSVIKSTGVPSSSVPPAKLESSQSTSATNMFSFKPASSTASSNMFSSRENPFSSTKPAESSNPPSNFSFDAQKMASNNNTSGFGQDAKKSNIFSFGADAPKETNKNANSGFNFGQTQTSAPTSLDFSFSQKTKPAEIESKASIFTFGNSGPPQATKASGFSFGQPSSEPSADFAKTFPFGKSVDSFSQAQPSFSNGDASMPSSFGSGIANPFSATSSSIGPAKNTSRIIKKAVRRTKH